MNEIYVNTIYLRLKYLRLIAFLAVLLSIAFAPVRTQVIENNMSSKDFDKATQSDTVAPQPIYNMARDGTVTGFVTDMPDDDKIRSNLGGIYPALTNYIFSNDSIVPGKTKSTKFRLEVVNKFSDAVADIKFTDWAGNSRNIFIQYNAPAFRITPGKQYFQEVITGQKLFTEFLITNESYKHEFPIEEIKLKHNNKGFRINFKDEHGYLGANLPRFFKPRDSLLVQIEFEATQEGYFSDSLGIGNGSVFSYMVEVSANVLSPIIVAADYNFFDITRGDTIKKELNVRNSSNKIDLILTGYSAVRHPFRTDLPQISPNEPYILKPGQQLNFNIFFTPDSIMDYQDSVVFSSNATVKDHISRLYGRGVKPGLMVTSFDWGRRRIDRPDRPELDPVNPYTNFERAVMLENTTLDTIELFDIDVIDIQKGYAFEFSKGDFPRFLAPREPRRVEVAFHPIEVGYHEIKLNYKTSIGNEAISTFKGIGIAPKIATNHTDFGTTTMGDYFSPESRRIVFKNERWEFEDMMELKEIIILPGGEEITDAVSNSFTTYGTEGFKIFDKNFTSLPIILNPGDSIAYDILFSAQKEGLAYAEMKSFSDALNDTVCRLTGWGLYRGLKPYSDSGSVCRFDIDTLFCKLVHFGYAVIYVDSLRFEGSTSFELIDSSLFKGFSVIKGETKHLRITYKPTSVTQEEALLRVFYNIDDEVRETVINLKGTSYHTDRTFTTYLMNDTNVFGLDKEFKVRIMLDYGEDISFYRLGEIALKVEYNTNILEFLDNKLERGSLLYGSFRQPEIIEKNLEKGYILINCKRVSDNYLKGDGTLFEMSFKTTKPLHPDSVYRSSIVTSLSTVGNHCVDFINSNLLDIEVTQSITDYLHWLDFSPEKNQLLDVRPNPSDISNPKIHFEILEDGDYKVAIFNNLGQEVMILFNDYLIPGNYELTIPIYYLPSGSYICYLNGMKFSANKKFIISK